MPPSLSTSVCSQRISFGRAALNAPIKTPSCDAIPSPRNGDEEIGRRKACRSESLADEVDVLFDVARCRVGAIRPDGGEDLMVRERTARLGNQQLEEGRLLRRQIDNGLSYVKALFIDGEEEDACPNSPSGVLRQDLRSRAGSIGPSRSLSMEEDSRTDAGCCQPREGCCECPDPRDPSARTSQARCIDTDLDCDAGLSRDHDIRDQAPRDPDDPALGQPVLRRSRERSVLERRASDIPSIRGAAEIARVENPGIEQNQSWIRFAFAERGEDDRCVERRALRVLAGSRALEPVCRGECCG